MLIVQTDAKFYYLRAIIHDYPDDEFWGVQSVNVCRFDSPVFGFDLQSLKSEILDSYMLC